MNISLNGQVGILLLVVVLLVILWLLINQRAQRYFPNIVAEMEASKPILKPVDNWSEISDPDSQGIMTTSGTCEMENAVGSIVMRVYGKQADEMKSYINDAKFYFSPIFEEPPLDITALMRGLLFSQSSAKNTAQKNQSLKNTSATSLSNDIEIAEDDLVLEYDFRPNVESNGIKTIAFVIDPDIRGGINRKHYVTTKGVYVQVKATVGSVACTLKQKGTVIQSRSAGSCVLSSSVTTQNLEYALTVTGRNNINHYDLSGTWNVT